MVFNIFLAYRYVVWLVVVNSDHFAILSIYVNCSQEGHTTVSYPLIGYDVGIHKYFVKSCMYIRREWE